MNWLKKIAQLPQSNGSSGLASALIPLVSIGRMDANDAAQQLMNERESCCSTLGEMLSNSPENQNLRALQNALKCFESTPPQAQMQPPKPFPAGATFMDQNGEPVNNNVSSEGA